ncbi:MAG: hypothetical protein WBG18_16190 [Xanthobacteraceae bacterium]
MPFLPALDLPEPPDHVFGMATPHHMLSKLAWEIGGLRQTVENQDKDYRSIMIAAYQAYNCAITAWHCADWAWSFGDEWVRAKLSERYDVRPVGKDRTRLDAFCNAVASRNRDIHICRSIANGSKHMKLTNPDPTVAAAFVWSERKNVEGDAHYGFELFIRDSGEDRQAVEVFRGAFDYWDGLFMDLGYVEPRYIGPDDDGDRGP